jgi:adenylosuccinate lyase
MENIALWHERDISHSSVERFSLPDVFITSDFMLHRLNNVVDKLVIHKENMYKNLMLTGGLVFSQRILLELPLKGVSREDAYKIVQQNAMKVWADLKQGKLAIDSKGNSLFLKYLLKEDKLKDKLSSSDIKKCFDTKYYTKNVNKILKRVFKK